LLGDHFSFDSQLFSDIEAFVCQLYGVKCSNTDEARYLKFVSGKKTPEPQKLPPTRDVLLCHCKRVSYVTAIVKRSLEQFHALPSLCEDYGWVLNNNELQVQWMIRDPAPEIVLQTISCSCRKSSCLTRACSCCSNGIKCTELCSCLNCSNLENESSTESEDEESDNDDNPESDEEEEL